MPYPRSPAHSHPLRQCLPLGIPASLALGLTLAVAGCHSHRPLDQGAAAAQMGERPVAMKGEALFFGGGLDATVTISRGVGMGAGRGGGSRPRIGDSGSETSGMSDDDAMAYLRARADLGSPMPPVTIRLKLQNRSGKIFQVDILETSSYLGNFAIEPELLSLAPGQTAEPDPMISQLGVTSDIIPFKVTLRDGEKIESQTIAVKNLTTSADAIGPLPPP